MAIQWELIGPALRSNPGETFVAGFERSAVRGAMEGAARGDPRAMRTLYQFDPQAAMQMEERQYQHGERRRAAEGRSALSEYLLEDGRGGAGALAPAPPNALAALPPSAAVPAGAAPTPLPGTVPAGALSALGGPTNALAVPPTSISGMATPGSPGSPANRPMSPPGFAPPMSARERAMRADPGAFLEAEGRQAQNRVRQVELTQGQFELMRDLNDFSLSTLGSVEAAPAEQRPALYTEALARARLFYQERGMEAQFDALNLPQQYDPSRVGTLLQQSMRGKEQLESMRAERRLTWDIQDDELDNERADENLESLDTWRRSGLGLRAAEEEGRNNRYSQGEAGRDRRFGQGEAGRNNRYQQGEAGRNTRHANPRSRPGRAGRGGGGGNSARAMLNGRAIVVRNNQWVYEDNGQAAR